jgi:hypothetical protein
LASNLPYLASPGSLKNALDKIRVAATPDRVTQDFVSTRLQIKGGTGAALIPFFKKVGFVGADGAPTEIYRQFRNHATAGRALADAVRFGYKSLTQANEYFYDLDDKDLLALIVQVTGVEADNQVAKLTLSTLKQLKAGGAQFTQGEGVNGAAKEADDQAVAAGQGASHPRSPLPIGLSYTINLNLPATSDQAVFNAIFKSLREHLLEGQ